MKRFLIDLGRRLAVPLIVVTVIVVLVLNDDAANRRHSISRGLVEMDQAMLRQDRQLTSGDAHFDALSYDWHSTVLKRMVSERRTEAAQNLAKEWLEDFYRRRLKEIEDSRTAVDYYLARMVRDGAEEGAVQAEFERLLEKPYREAQKELEAAAKVAPAKALPLMLDYYERAYQAKMQRAKELQADT